MLLEMLESISLIKNLVLTFYTELKRQGYLCPDVTRVPHLLGYPKGLNGSTC